MAHMIRSVRKGNGLGTSNRDPQEYSGNNGNVRAQTGIFLVSSYNILGAPYLGSPFCLPAPFLSKPTGELSTLWASSFGFFMKMCEVHIPWWLESRG